MRQFVLWLWGLTRDRSSVLVDFVACHSRPAVEGWGPAAGGAGELAVLNYALSRYVYVSGECAVCVIICGIIRIIRSQLVNSV